MYIEAKDPDDYRDNLTQAVWQQAEDMKFGAELTDKQIMKYILRDVKAYTKAALKDFEDDVL